MKPQTLARLVVRTALTLAFAACSASSGHFGGVAPGGQGGSPAPAADAAFAARKLRAVLSLEYPDHTKLELEDAKMVSGPSDVERLETTFNFLVPAASVKAGATMVASVYETGAPAGMDPAMPPRFP